MKYVLVMLLSCIVFTSLGCRAEVDTKDRDHGASVETH
jgi:hypothetical protein